MSIAAIAAEAAPPWPRKATLCHMARQCEATAAASRPTSDCPRLPANPAMATASSRLNANAYPAPSSPLAVRTCTRTTSTLGTTTTADRNGGSSANESSVGTTATMRSVAMAAPADVMDVPAGPSLRARRDRPT